MDKLKSSLAALMFAPMMGSGCICVARGARVWTPEGRRRIEEIELGDAIFSIDPETGQFVEGTVTHRKQGERECVALELGDGRTLRCTSDHPIYDPEAGEYAPAGDWAEGERTALATVVDGELEVREAADVEMYAGIDQVFDLTTDTAHNNFVADGVVVHNKQPPPRTCELDGETVERGSACTCPSGETGTVECSTSEVVPDATGADGGPKLREIGPRCVCPSDTSDAGPDGGPDAGDASGADATDDTSADDAGDAAETGG